jgi:predicted aspartyl protease
MTNDRKMKTIIPIKILHIDNDGYHLMADITINRKKAKVIIDTGASRTVFDKDRIKKYVKTRSKKIKDKLSTGLGTSSMESHHLEISSLSIGKITIKKYATVLLDLSHVNNSYAQLGLEQIEGVLGSDILYNYKARIDFAKSIMELNSK